MRKPLDPRSSRFIDAVADAVRCLERQASRYERLVATIAADAEEAGKLIAYRDRAAELRTVVGPLREFLIGKDTILTKKERQPEQNTSGDRYSEHWPA